MGKKKGSTIFNSPLHAAFILCAACALLFTTCYLEGDINALRPIIPGNPDDPSHPGFGTDEYPYKVFDEATLKKVGSGDDGWDMKQHYIQTADIDLSEVDNWDPIGTDSNPFEGSYDGGDFKISNLKINRPGIDFQGLFGHISGEGVVVTNVKLGNVDINGGNNVGGVAGYVAEGSSVEHCYSTGKIIGSYYVGAVAGFVARESSVTNCSSSGNVSSDEYAGGVVGCIYRASVERCYSTGDVSGNYAGGVAAFVDSGGNITDCYSTSNVTGNKSNSNAGGVVGSIESNGSVTNCYSTGNVVNSGNNLGGVTGNNRGTVGSCVALGPSVNTENASSNIGRVAGFNTGKIENNYAYSDMVITGEGTITPGTLNYGAENKHGANVKEHSHDDGEDEDAIDGYYDIGFWTGTMGWDFGKIWEMGEDSLPVFQDWINAGSGK